jgi:hypothetical protein
MASVPILGHIITLAAGNQPTWHLQRERAMCAAIRFVPRATGTSICHNHCCHCHKHCRRRPLQMDGEIDVA